MSEDTVLEFAPIRGFNAGEIPTDAPAGQWTAVANVAKKSLAKDSDGIAKFPMITVAITLEGTDDAENESFVGTQLKDFLICYPKGHKNARMGKERLHGMAAAFGFEPTVVPDDIETWEDLDALCEALEGKRGVIYTWIKTDRNTQEKRTQVAYSAPRRRGN